MNWYDQPRTAWEQPGYTVAGHTTSPPVNWSNVDNIVLHYTADKTANPDTAQYLANIQRSYVNNRGYSIGYSVAIDQTGMSWELRGTDYIPAANKNYNSVTWVILCLVDWQNPCNTAMVDTVRNLVKFARTQIGRDVPVIGHRDLAATQCPGNGIYAQIEEHVFEPVTPEPSPEVEVKLVDPPTRIYDSRQQGGRFKDGESRKISTGKKGAVFVNVTIVQGAGEGGFATVWGNGAMPDVSNVNYSHGQTIANTSWVPVAPDGTIQVYCYRSCDVLIDLQATV
jgi:hypothetical protein